MMASEGFDFRYPLDTVLASPKSKKLTGVFYDKKQNRVFVPLIADIFDDSQLLPVSVLRELNFATKIIMK